MIKPDTMHTRSLALSSVMAILLLCVIVLMVALGTSPFTAGTVSANRLVSSNALSANLICPDSQNCTDDVSLPKLSFRVPGNPTNYPVSNSHSVPLTSTASITYDEPISATTVSTRTFAVHGMQTGLLTQTYDVSSGTVSLSPLRPFNPGEIIQVSATTGTLSQVDGTGPISATVWQFRTTVSVSSGLFTGSSQNLDRSQLLQAVALGDIDGDGDLDAFVVSGGLSNNGNTIWLNDGDGLFSDSGQSLGNSPSADVAVGDMDGDGDLDAFVAEFGGDTVWLNDGAGLFSNSLQSLTNTATTSAVALGDVDGDGDLDAFIAVVLEHNKLWLNDGTGTFTDSGQLLTHPDTNGNGQDVALGDVDGDGDLDAFVANDGGPNEVWLNNGDGLYIAGNQRLGDFNSVAVSLGDLDGDGDLDAFVGNNRMLGEGGGNRVWLNDGLGTFSDSLQSLGSFDSSSVVLGDVDGDGDLDAFVANSRDGPEPTEIANKVWLNDASGEFSDSSQNLGDSGSEAVALGDVDGDGDLDAFVTSGSGASKVWLNLPKQLLNLHLPIVLMNQ